jgi:hypothetical protein
MQIRCASCGRAPPRSGTRSASAACKRSDIEFGLKPSLVVLNNLFRARSSLTLPTISAAACLKLRRTCLSEREDGAAVERQCQCLRIGIRTGNSASRRRSAQVSPLTKSECDKAGMAWNDRANVCGEKSQTQAAARTTTLVSATILINIDKTKQRMTVFLDGLTRSSRDLSPCRWRASRRRSRTLRKSWECEDRP